MYCLAHRLIQLHWLDSAADKGAGGESARLHDLGWKDLNGWPQWF
jgi:hypothetical protein